MFDPRKLRKDKTTPCEDMWHVLRVGIPICGVMFVLLPWLMR